MEYRHTSGPGGWRNANSQVAMNTLFIDCLKYPKRSRVRIERWKIPTGLCVCPSTWLAVRIAGSNRELIPNPITVSYLISLAVAIRIIEGTNLLVLPDCATQKNVKIAPSTSSWFEDNVLTTGPTPVLVVWGILFYILGTERTHTTRLGLAPAPVQEQGSFCTRPPHYAEQSHARNIANLYAPATSLRPRFANAHNENPSRRLINISTFHYKRKIKRYNIKKRKERYIYIPTSRQWSKRERRIHNDTKRQNKIMSRMRAL
ncbi:hypothetical protein EVAR_4111_1 [Eumeta japonica]|uniref:Uncharacterized protein n=1 Tax=Eumeta variegata TaxID=151549 RepID=A0A4C1T417_EUMVA|nr:hypothetical protein EVAR_4111_1 [Eumeta japonica]